MFVRALRASTLLALLALPLVVSGCGGGGGGSSPAATSAGIEADPNYGVIRGVVTDPSTGAPLARAIVQLNAGADLFRAPAPSAPSVRRAIGATPVAMTVTDERGYYEFARVAPGEYAIRVTREDGRAGAFFTARAVAGQIADGNIELTPVASLSGTILIPLPERDGMPPIAWVAGTSFGSIGAPAGEVSGHATYSFTISGVPVRAGVSYELTYFGEGMATARRTVAFTSLSTVTIDGAAAAYSNFTVSLPAVTLAASTVPENRPPAANAGADQLDLEAGSLVTLDGSASSDPDGDALTYLWQQTGGPIVDLSDPAVAAPTFTAVAGDCYFALVVSDGRSTSQPDFVRLRAAAAANRPPLANAGADRSVLVGTPVTLDGSGSSDPDSGTTLSYEWKQVTGPAVPLSTPTAAQTAFTPSLPGSYLFALVVSDGKVAGMPDFVEIRVDTATNATPAAVAAATGELVPGSLVTLNGSGSNDSDGGPQPLSFVWSQLLGPAVTLAGADTAVATATLPAPGEYQFKLVVFDGAARAETVVRLDVSPSRIDKAKVTVLMNPPGVQDEVLGAAGAVPAGATVKAYAEPTLDTPLGETVAAGDGSFGPFAIGDNANRTVSDAFFLALVDPSGGKGPAITLANDTTPPALGRFHGDAPLPAIHQGNLGTYAADGRTEPGALVEVILALDPQTRVSATGTADGGGLFSVAFPTLGLLPDATALSVLVRLSDAAGNQSAPLKVQDGLVKDTVGPVVVIGGPLDDSIFGAGTDLLVNYRLSEAASSLDATMTRTGGNADPTVRQFTLPSSAAPDLSAGEHNVGLPLFDTPPVHGAVYRLDLTVTDLHGNVSAVASAGNLACDTQAPAGIAFLSPGNGQTVITEPFVVAYDLAGADEPVVAGRIRLVPTGGVADPAGAREAHLHAAHLTPEGHSFAPFASPLQPGAVYELHLHFSDLMGNETDLSTTNLTARGPDGTVTILAPAARGKIRVAQPVVELHFTRDMRAGRIELAAGAGMGPKAPGASPARFPVNPSPVVVDLAGDDLLAGPHAILLPTDPPLLDGVSYDLTFTGTDADGRALPPVSVIDVTADGIPPTLVAVQAIQKETFFYFDMWAGEVNTWNAGDQVIFRFSEPMDTSAAGGLGTNDQIKTGFGAFEDFPKEWGDFTFAWSEGGATLTLTVVGPAMPTFRALPAGHPDISRITLGGCGDTAGNPIDGAGQPLPLVATGDVTPPSVSIKKPLPGSMLDNDPGVEWSLSEGVQSLKFSLVPVTALDPLALREFPMEYAALTPTAPGQSHGNTLWCQSNFPLVDGCVYTLQCDAVDMAGNSTRTTVGNLTFNPSFATAPPVESFSFRASGVYDGNPYRGHVLFNANVQGGDRILVVRFTNPGGAVFECLCSDLGYGYYWDGNAYAVDGFTNDVQPGAAIQYFWRDGDGTLLSPVASEGTLPFEPTPNDVAGLWIDRDVNAYTVRFEGGQFEAANTVPMKLYVSFNDYAIPVSHHVGNVDASGLYTPIEDAIPALNAGDTVHYFLVDPDGNGSHASDQDGVIASFDPVDPYGYPPANYPGPYNAEFDAGDTLRFHFTSPVTAPAFGESSFALHPAPPDSGSYTWSATKGELNIAFPGDAVPYTVTAFQVSCPGGTGVTFDLSIGTFTITPYSPPYLGRVAIDLHPRGSRLFRSEGGHVVLPVDTVQPDGVLLTGSEVYEFIDPGN